MKRIKDAIEELLVSLDYNQWEDLAALRGQNYPHGDEKEKLLRSLLVEPDKRPSAKERQ